MTSNQPIPTVQESFKQYNPPISSMPVVMRLLTGIPEIYLSGLDLVLLTNQEGVNRKKRRQKTIARKRKVAVNKCRGLYHKQWQGKPAKIELFVDNIIMGVPEWALRVPFISDIIFADVLYHELGHHVHYTKSPEYREREDVADDWQKKLGRLYFRRKYWYLSPVVSVILLVTKPFRKKRRS